MGARPVAIEDARIVDFEGAFLVVEAPVVGRLLVPSEMIDDDSEVWRVGDAGTLLVAGAWAKQRGIKGKRKPRVVSAPVAGAPVELVRKAAREPPPTEMVRVPDAVLAQDHARNRSKQAKHKAAKKVDPNGASAPVPDLSNPKSKTRQRADKNWAKQLEKAKGMHFLNGRTLPRLEASGALGDESEWSLEELTQTEGERGAEFDRFLAGYGMRGAVLLASIMSETGILVRSCPVLYRIKTISKGSGCKQCPLCRQRVPCVHDAREVPRVGYWEEGRAHLRAWYNRLVEAEGYLPDWKRGEWRGCQAMLGELLGREPQEEETA